MWVTTLLGSPEHLTYIYNYLLVIFHCISSIHISLHICALMDLVRVIRQSLTSTPFLVISRQKLGSDPWLVCSLPFSPLTTVVTKIMFLHLLICYFTFSNLLYSSLQLHSLSLDFWHFLCWSQKHLRLILHSIWFIFLCYQGDLFKNTHLFMFPPGWKPFVIFRMKSLYVFTWPAPDHLSNTTCAIHLVKLFSPSILYHLQFMESSMVYSIMPFI